MRTRPLLRGLIAACLALALLPGCKRHQASPSPEPAASSDPTALSAPSAAPQTGAVRFDGMYGCREDFSDSVVLMRFYGDGSVIDVTTMTVDGGAPNLESIGRWFNPANANVAKGRYSVSGSSVQFKTKGGGGNATEYRGTVTADGAEMRLEESAATFQGKVVLHFGEIMASCSRPLGEPAPQPPASAADEKDEVPLHGPPGDVVIGDIAVRGPGSLPEDAVHLRLENRRSKLEVCYARLQALYHAALAGDMQVAFTVAADGAVVELRRTGGTLDLSTINACVLATYATMRFHPPKGGEAHVVSALSFRHSGGPSL